MVLESAKKGFQDLFLKELYPKKWYACHDARGCMQIGQKPSLLSTKKKLVMLCPKRTSYRKYQKGKGKKPFFYKSGDVLQFGRFGIKVKKSGTLTGSTIEAVRRIITRKLKRTGQIWIRVFPNKPFSQKPLATRMGKGKGTPSYWYVSVYAGQIIFEMDGVPTSLAQQAYVEAAKKLPLCIAFIKQ